MISNICRANFNGGGRTAQGNNRFQWDYGQILEISGIENLPDPFTAQFSNYPVLGTAKTTVGTGGRVEIPNEYFVSGQNIYCFIVLHTDEDDGRTVYVATIPVTKRPKPIDDPITPTQQSTIDTAIAALQAGVSRAEGFAGDAEEQATIATGASTTATEAAETATGAVDAVEAAATRAETAAEGAEQSATDAEASATAAAASATAASGSASDSAASATAAEGFAENASTSAGNASQAAQNASQSATAASGSATSAAGSATAAAGSATTAENKATEAAQSATGAAASATTAESAKTAAQAAQTAAETAQTAAETAQGAAEDAAESVEGKTEQIDQNTEDISLLKSHLTSVVDEITSYPAKTDVINITSTDFVQGYRHNQSGASIKNDSGYTTTKNVIHFKKGDIFTHPTDQGITYFFVTTAGAFYETYVSSPYTVPEDVELYLDCRKSGITPQTTPTVQYTTKTIIEKIVEKDESLQAQIDKFKVNFPELEECYKQGDASIKQGYKLSNGAVVSTSATWLCCTEKFMECKTGDIFLVINCFNIARYTDSDPTSYVSTVAVANLPLYSGNERWNVWVADLDGYVRFTLYWSDPVECAVTRLNLSDHPYTCVCLGDSIFGNNQKPNDLPTYMQKVDHLMSANCGFGGTEAATHFNPIYTPLSFWSIADAISTGDWTTIDVDWNAINNDHVFMVNVYILCHLVDWSKVRTITVAYGTNDWNGGVNIDNADDPKDVTTYKGALRYGIEKIQSAYPHINIVLLSPLFRYWSNSSDYSTVDDDSDNRINTGRKLTDYVTAMKEVADEYHLPFFDNYNTAGINKITAPYILRDGTHLNYKYGVSMVGKHIGAEVALSNQNINE